MHLYPEEMAHCWGLYLGISRAWALGINFLGIWHITYNFVSLNCLIRAFQILKIDCVNHEFWWQSRLTLLSAGRSIFDQSKFFWSSWNWKKKLEKQVQVAWYLTSSSICIVLFCNFNMHGLIKKRKLPFPFLIFAAMKTLLVNCLAKSVWKFCLSSSTRLFSQWEFDAPFSKIYSNTVFLQPACQQAGKRLLLHLNLMKKFLFPFVKLKWVEETT